MRLFDCDFQVYATLKSVIKAKYGQDACNVGDEGGFAPSIQSNYEGTDLLMEAIKKAGYEKEVRIGMDVAASEFHKNKMYDLDFKSTTHNGSSCITGPALADVFKDLVAKYPIITIEDPFDQDDWENYTAFTAAMGDKIQIVGDDLLVTNTSRIIEANSRDACNALLLKVNQIGTVTESINAVKMAKRNGWGVMTSHRSGETEDNYIADLAVGLCTGQIRRVLRVVLSDSPSTISCCASKKNLAAVLVMLDILFDLLPGWPSKQGKQMKLNETMKIDGMV